MTREAKPMAHDADAGFEKPFDVEDMSVALIKLKSGRTVLLETSWAAHQPVAAQRV